MSISVTVSGEDATSVVLEQVLSDAVTVSGSNSIQVTTTSGDAATVTISTGDPVTVTGNYSNYVTGDVVRPNEISDFLTSAQISSNINSAIDSLIDSAPDALNTLNELAAALNDDENFGSDTIVSISNLNSATGQLSTATGLLVQKSETGIFYTNDNPSGFITGVDLSDLEAATGNLDSRITSNDGDISALQTATGLLVQKSETGSFISESQTGQFYASSNPSGFITGVDLSYLETATGNLDSRLTSNDGDISDLQTATGLLVQKTETGNFITIFDTGAFYANSNPSGFITGVDLSSYVQNSETGNFITDSDTGAFYAASNPSGFITGVDLSSYVQNSETGLFLVSGEDAVVNTIGVGGSPDNDIDIHVKSNSAKFLVENTLGGGEWVRFSAGTVGSSMKFSNTASFSIGPVASKTDTSLVDDFYMASNGNIGIGTDTPSGTLDIKSSSSDTPIVITKANENGVRERLLTATIASSINNESFFINNGTIGDNNFAPVFGGYTESTTRWALGFGAYTSSTADSSDSSNFGLIDFAVFRSTNSADPLNGTLTNVQNRKAFTFRGASSSDVWMTIMPSGNVGIGTDSPISKLNISETGGNNSLIIDNGNGAFGVFGHLNTSANSPFVIKTNASEDLYFNIGKTLTETTPSMMIDGSNGNVGIGTDTPSAKLHIYDETDSSFAIGRVGIPSQLFSIDYNNGWATFGTEASDDLRLKVANTTAIQIEGDTNENQFDVDIALGNLSVSTDNKYLKLGASQDAGITYDGTNMVFDSQLVGVGDFVFENGNVGIGTSSPSAKLDVSGDANIDGTLTVDKISLSDNSFIVETGDFTLSGSHKGATILLQNTAAISITIPALSAGHTTSFIAETANTVAFQAGAGLSGLNSFNGANSMLGQFAQAQIIFKTPEYAFLGGQIT